MDCYVPTHRKCTPAHVAAFTDEMPGALIARLRALPGRDIWICGGVVESGGTARLTYVSPE